MLFSDKLPKNIKKMHRFQSNESILSRWVCKISQMSQIIHTNYTQQSLKINYLHFHLFIRRY